VEPAPVAAEPPSSSLATESTPAEPVAAEEEDDFAWGQTKSRAGSRKGSKATSKAASKAASKAPSPKGIQTPKSQDPTTEEAGAGVSAESSATERTKPPSGDQTPLATVPENPPPEAPVVEGLSAPPGSFFVTNADKAQDAQPPLSSAQTEPISFPSFGGSLSGGVGGGLLGAATSAFGGGWGSLGKKEGKSKPTTPKTPTPAWGGFGSVAASVTESTGGIGWGSATGNNSGSNTGWLGLGGGNKSANASSADLLGAGGTTDIPLQGLGESGESHSQLHLEETPATEAQEGDAGQDDFHTPGPLTIKTDVTAAAEAETAVPTTAAGDEPEAEGHEGGGGDGGEEETGEKAEDEWPAWGIKTKKNKKGGSGNTTTNATTPVNANASGGGEENWASAPAGKKGKKGKRK